MNISFSLIKFNTMPFPKKNKPVESYDEDFEIIDPENWQGEEDIRYSHELLVMEQLRRTLKTLSQEMKKGYEEQKTDRIGNLVSSTMHPDTRREAAEAIETLKNVMVGYITDDEDSDAEIRKLLKDLKEIEDYYIKEEQKAWDSIQPHIKAPGSSWNNRWEHVNGALNYDYVYGEVFLQQSIKIWRQILERIVYLMHKMDYFRAKHI